MIEWKVGRIRRFNQPERQRIGNGTKKTSTKMSQPGRLWCFGLFWPKPVGCHNHSPRAAKTKEVLARRCNKKIPLALSEVRHACYIPKYQNRMYNHNNNLSADLPSPYSEKTMRCNKDNSRLKGSHNWSRPGKSFISSYAFRGCWPFSASILS